MFSVDKQLGKIKNPITDKVEKDLGAASMSIDMLSMIQEKTKGNLEDYESQLLEKTLNDLKMNFVFEKNQDSTDKVPEEPEKIEKAKKTNKKPTSKKKK